MRRIVVIQLSLLILGVILILYTYNSKEKEEQIVDVDIAEDNIVISSTDEIKNIIENANYIGTNNKGTFFEINSAIAKILNDEPNLSYMEKVNAVIDLRDGRKINIKSDNAIFNRLTNDTKFIGNILVTESDSIITSDNLDLQISKNLITAYNNVKYDSKKGFLIADKVDIDILTKEASIFMFDSENKVQVQYKN